MEIKSRKTYHSLAPSAFHASALLPFMCPALPLKHTPSHLWGLAQVLCSGRENELESDFLGEKPLQGFISSSIKWKWYLLIPRGFGGRSKLIIHSKDLTSGTVVIVPALLSLRKCSSASIASSNVKFSVKLAPSLHPAQTRMSSPSPWARVLCPYLQDGPTQTPSHLQLHCAHLLVHRLLSTG